MVLENTPIQTTISPDILDTIGKTFKFKHAKGVAEWLKNSLDNYLRLYEMGLVLQRQLQPCAEAGNC